LLRIADNVLGIGVQLTPERRLMMAQQQRPRRQRGDAIRDLQEWQNHQYDPGYLSNLGRLRLFSGGHPSAARLLLTRLGAILALVLVYIAFVSVGMPFLIATILVGIAMTMILVVTLVQLQPRQEHRSRHHTRRRR
jgi:Flp pilus assembly protein TadB